MSNKELVIISMSGGLDSDTLCAEALYQGKDVFILNFKYGQKNWVEKFAFEQLKQHFEQRTDLSGHIIGHRDLDLVNIFDDFIKLWTDMRDTGKMKEKSDHTYYTPARNLLFAVISTVVGEIIALARDYETVNIGLGIHQHSVAAYGEHKDYWDITPEFANRLQHLLALDNVKNIELFAPFADSFKRDIVRRAIKLDVPWTKTWTCYNPQNEHGYWIPCEKCEACIERQIAGNEAGVPDINNYRIKIVEDS